MHTHFLSAEKEVADLIEELLNPVSVLISSFALCTVLTISFSRSLPPLLLPGQWGLH